MAHAKTVNSRPRGLAKSLIALARMRSADAAERGEELAVRLKQRDGVLSRTDLRELGYERRAIDAIFKAVPVQVWPGYSRPLIGVADFLDWRERSTYRDDKVRVA